jgi:hypothetical protein
MGDTAMKTLLLCFLICTIVMVSYLAMPAQPLNNEAD